LIEEQKALILQACPEFIQSVDDNHSLLDSVVKGNETWCFPYDPKTRNKAWNGACQALQDTKFYISKVKKQSDVDHILRQSGNRSERICSTR
jgi:hypothetical protein